MTRNTRLEALNIDKEGWKRLLIGGVSRLRDQFVSVDRARFNGTHVMTEYKVINPLRFNTEDKARVHVIRTLET